MIFGCVCCHMTQLQKSYTTKKFGNTVIDFTHLWLKVFMEYTNMFFTSMPQLQRLKRSQTQ